MPTIDIDYNELQRLLKIEINDDIEKLDDILSYVKSEVKLWDKENGIVNIEFKDTNRPDLWSVEGLARALRGYLQLDKGMKQYIVDEAELDVNVDHRLKDLRPFICCSVIKGIKLTDSKIRGLMHLQDKLDKTYGRSRQKTSIGIYNYDLIKQPLNYTVATPSEFSFVPLGFSEKMTLAEILERHPKGLEYGHIVKNSSIYPILIDSEQKVLSFPPIINSNDLGRVTEETQNLLVEVTGTIHHAVINTLNLVTISLIEQGGKAYAATIHYPNDKIYPSKLTITPDFSSRSINLDVAYTNKILGLSLTSNQIAELLLTAGLNIGTTSELAVEIIVPCYRTDVMHPIDLVEDVAIAYGYNNIAPRWRDLPTTGAEKVERRLINLSRELMVGSGYQEVLTYTLTNSENLFTKMNCKETPIVEVVNPKVATMTCLRNWLLPSLMEFLSNNKSVEFPQKIFEVGKVTFIDETSETKTRDEDWLAAASSHINANFSEIKAVLDAFLRNLNVTWKIQAINHSCFIEGRSGSVVVSGESIGIIGEVHPQVLEAWRLENPVAAFELNLNKMRKNVNTV
ncbi:MAG: phenylalanine--tRNA ligase subunit beta [Candidatus Bathyarchaeota archaeon]|nr:phenylalanine--tRNA ligase subunit beta [Candidatus Bathyarchaeota archaeon]